jgi:hypothetical protein
MVCKIPAVERAKILQVCSEAPRPAYFDKFVSDMAHFFQQTHDLENQTASRLMFEDDKVKQAAEVDNLAEELEHLKSDFAGIFFHTKLDIDQFKIEALKRIEDNTQSNNQMLLRFKLLH